MDFVTSKAVDVGLSSLFQAMYDALTRTFLPSPGFLFGVEGEAEKLKSTLSRIQAHLKDAEDRQITEESVRLWLRELKDAAYDAENIVDEVEYQVLRSKIEGAQMQTRKKRKLTDQVSGLFSSSVSNLDMGPRIKEIRERLEQIESRGDHLHLKKMLESEMVIPGKRHPTSSILDESIVFGREADREEVVGLLTSDGDSSAANSGIQVVSICGMGGLGKTTLAQQAYNDERVQKHFAVKAWVYVSEDFDLIKLTKDIAESVLGSNPGLTNLDAIQVRIKEALKEKRFLLVLDDVWTENLDDWRKLRAPLISGARGSRVLVTTRSRRVSSNMKPVSTHFLQGLSDDDSWSLFERLAFVDEDSDAHPELVKIGKEIVNKCNGLPLAVKTLGGLLGSIVDVVRWKRVLKSDIWDLPEGRNDILPALRLSYHYLPAHLKRCFAYCACLIKKGWYGVEGNELIWEWMAQGFIQPKRSTSEQMEDIGREYLADLVSRSLLNCRETSCESPRYTMHDLTHDLARSVLGTDFLKIGDEKSHGNNAEKARYMSDSFCNFEDMYGLKGLRTLSLLFPGNISADLFKNLRHIRILRLLGKNTELPESIGDLLQLRYLKLSYSSIKRLPISTTRLYNLQTLILYCCEQLVEVPESIGDLLQLRCLHLSDVAIKKLPESTTKLDNLQTLILDRCWELVEVPASIGSLSQLRYLDLSSAPIKKLPESTTELCNLQTLILKYCRELVEVPESIGDLLQLRYLDLSYTAIKTLPESIANLYNLQTLILNRCKQLVEVPESIGDLLQLRYLDLSGAAIKRLPESTTGLHNLQTLKLYDYWKPVEPPRIGTLKGLQTLDYFNVRKEIGCGINELKELMHLSGLLCIAELENVDNVEEAKEAQLKNKQKIDALKLRWKCDDVQSRQEGIEEQVLNALQPHTNLQQLEIKGYCGVRFPTWLGDSSFSKLVNVCLCKCRCRLLPPFGRLPSLKYLQLEDLYELKKVGRDFYGDGSVTGFPPLEWLSFSSMPDLEELSGLESDIRHIRAIDIRNCSRLSLSSLRYLTSLSSLRVSSFPNLTSLGNGLQHLTSLQSLKITHCQELTSLYDVDLPATLDDGLGNSNYSNPTCFLKGLQELELIDCPKIPSLPEELLTTLQSLEIYSCPLLMEKYRGNEYPCKIAVAHIPRTRFL